MSRCDDRDHQPPRPAGRGAQSEGDRARIDAGRLDFGAAGQWPRRETGPLASASCCAHPRIAEIGEARSRRVDRSRLHRFRTMLSACLRDGRVRAASWCFLDERTSYTEAVPDAVSRSADTPAPRLWAYEVHNSVLAGPLASASRAPKRKNFSRSSDRSTFS